MPELFKKDCRRKRDYLEQLNRSFTRASMNLSWKNRFLESRDVVISQFRELAVILEEFSRQIDEAKNITEEYKGAVKKAFRRYHILVDSMLCWNMKAAQGDLSYSKDHKRTLCTSKDAAELMESVFLIPPGFRQRTVAVSSHAGMKQCGLKKKEIIILPGCCGSSKQGERYSGDNYSFVSEAAVR